LNKSQIFFLVLALFFFALMLYTFYNFRNIIDPIVVESIISDNIKNNESAYMAINDFCININSYIKHQNSKIKMANICSSVGFLFAFLTSLASAYEARHKRFDQI